MIIYPNNKEDLNLQQQVEKNKRDIAAHYEIDRTLADYGIKIIGFYDTIENAINDLGNPYDGPYGNAVGIGAQAPYTFYIWTRANNISDFDYWQDVGELAVVGPAGKDSTVPGPQGEDGRPAHIYTGNGFPTISASPNDIYMVTGGDQNMIGNIYQIVDGVWTLKGNIRGPQGLSIKGDTGARGPAFTFNDLTPAQKEQLKGDRGDPGGFIKIAGFKVSEDDLPLPTELQDLEVAYLVGATEPYDLWMQVGTTYENAIWTNIGPLNVATYVSVDGEFQNIWDADTKLDKANISDGEYHAYVIDDEGYQTTMYISQAADPGAVVMRGPNGELYVPYDPELPNEAVSKQYVDGFISDSETIVRLWEGPDLTLNLNAELVADIAKSVKTPDSPSAITTFPVYNRGTGEITWNSTSTYIPVSYQPKYQTKVGTWVPAASAGTQYTLYPSGETFNMTVKKTDDTVANYTDLTYANFFYINKTTIYLRAYRAATSVYTGTIKAVSAVGPCVATLLKHASGTVQ